MENYEDLYYQLRKAPSRKSTGPRSKFSPEVQAERTKEIRRRSIEAQRRAQMALARLYPDDYQRLRSVALDEVRNERGPLPGDTAIV